MSNRKMPDASEMFPGQSMGEIRKQMENKKQENKEVKDLIRKLNELDIIQTSFGWFEDLPDDIWEEYFKDNHQPVETGLNIDTHRWYETALNVYPVGDSFIGVQFVHNVFSESTELIDIFWTLRFYEMEPHTVTTYRQK